MHGIDKRIEHKADPKSRFARALAGHFITVGMNPYRLAKATGQHEQYVYKICRGECRPSDAVLEKFAAVASMRIDIDTLKAWRALDDYTDQQLWIANNRVLAGVS